VAGKPKSGNVATLDRIEDRAAQSGASPRTQRMADKVAKKSPALAKKVAHGEMSLPAAHKQVSKPSKILPRKELREPEADPLDVAREHAKKQNGVIRKLRAEVIERDSRIEALTGELAETLALPIEAANARDISLVEAVAKHSVSVRAPEHLVDLHLIRAEIERAKDISGRQVDDACKPVEIETRQRAVRFREVDTE
jgi:hypothetical protein